MILGGYHDDVMNWKWSLHWRPSVRGIHSTVGFPWKVANDTELWNIHCSQAEQALEQTAELQVLWDAARLMWCHCNDWHDTTANSYHYDDVIMGAMAYQITSLMIVYSTVYSDTDQRKHQSSSSRGPVNSPHKWPVTRKMPPFDDVIMF